jgi:RNA polymerase sigma-70 factor (ECF subfamily)
VDDEDHAADLRFAAACGAGDPSALAELERHHLPALRGPLAKLGLDDAGIAETLQMVREELLVARDGRAAKILDYSGRGALQGWLRSVAVRTGLRLIKTTPKHAELADDHDQLAADPELAYMKRTYGEVFHRALATALGELSAKDRLLLKQRFKHQMGVVELGTQYGVNAGTISRWVQTARDALAGLTRSAMMRELGVGTVDLDSILRLIHSQLDVSLSGAENSPD